MLFARNRAQNEAKLWPELGHFCAFLQGMYQHRGVSYGKLRILRRGERCRAGKSSLRSWIGWRGSAAWYSAGKQCTHGTSHVPFTAAEEPLGVTAELSGVDGLPHQLAALTAAGIVIQFGAPRKSTAIKLRFVLKARPVSMAQRRRSVAGDADAPDNPGARRETHWMLHSVSPVRNSTRSSGANDRLLMGRHRQSLLNVAGRVEHPTPAFAAPKRGAAPLDRLFERRTCGSDSPMLR